MTGEAEAAKAIVEEGPDEKALAKRAVVEKFKTKAGDTGSPEVQIALLSERIQSITGHLTTHGKDHATRRGLMMLVGKRNTLLKYLAEKSPSRYEKITETLGLRK